jgi:hypothetical protein
MPCTASRISIVRRKRARSMSFRFLSVMMLGYICSGCLKLEHQVTSPGARGVVLDAQTHAPLAGADVVVSRLHYLSTNPPAVSDALTNTRPPVVTTRKDGRFRIPAEQHRELIVNYLIEPYRARGGTLIVQRAGYEPVAIPLWGGLRPISAPPPTNFIQVLLSPVSK